MPEEMEGTPPCGMCGDDSRPTAAIWIADGGGRFLNLCFPCTEDTEFCDGCGDRTFQIAENAFGDMACPTCVEDALNEAESPDDWFDDDEYGTPSWSATVHGYSHRPNPIFRAGDDLLITPERTAGRLVMGVELEFRGIRGIPDELIDEERTYLKQDTSVDLELVTHPGTYRAHANGRVMDNRLWEWISENADLDDGCGMHVHMNRNAFVDVRQVRGGGTRVVPRPGRLWNLDRIFRQNIDEWQTVGGRGATSWAKWSDEDARLAHVYARGERAQPDRYAALNYQNTATVELRWPESTLNRHTAVGRLSLFQAAFDLASGITHGDVAAGATDWQSFRAHVGSRAADGEHPYAMGADLLASLGI